MPAEGISGNFRHLRQSRALKRCEFKGKSWSTFRQSCDLAQSSPFESPSGLKPSPSVSKSCFLLVSNYWHLKQVKAFGERNFFPFLFLPWTCQFTHFPLMRRPTTLVSLPPTRKKNGGIWNCTQDQHPLRSLWMFAYEEGCVFSLHDFSDFFSNGKALFYQCSHAISPMSMSAPRGQGYISVFFKVALPAFGAIPGS